MNQFEQLGQLIEEHGDTIQTFRVLKSGISKPAFYAYVKKKELETTTHGIYVSPNAQRDTIYLLYLRCGQTVFPRKTALFFHNLTDRKPFKYSIAVKIGYTFSWLQENSVKVYTVKKLRGVGLTTAPLFGHIVPVYGMEQIIYNLLRSRNNIEIQALRDAIKQHARKKAKNLRTQMQYAIMSHIEKMLRHIW